MSASESGEGETEFLRQQVQRLNAVLSQYQRKHPPPSPDDEAATPLPADGPHPSWLTNRRLLTPLLTEYDAVISGLNSQIATYKSELESLRSRVQQVVDENTRLHSQLQQSLEAQLEASGVGIQAPGATTAVEGLQHQLDILSKERSSYLELWKQSSQELEHLQRAEREKAQELLKCRAELATVQQAAASSRKMVEELQATCQQVDEERQQCLRAAQGQERELGTLQESLGQCRAELKAASLKNSDLKKDLDKITLQLKKREAERQRSEGHDQTLDDRVHHLHLAAADLEGKLLAAQREAALIKGEKTDLDERVALLQSKCSALEQREGEAILHVKESMQLVESAIMDKEQVQIREQQLAQEVGRQKKVIATLVQEASERTHREVAVVREECNRSIDKMAEEIKKLEEESSERQAQLERALREKKAVERDLEVALAAGPLQRSQAGETLHELQSRGCVAERARDEARLQTKRERAARRRAEASLAEERCACEQEREEQRKWQKRMSEECQQLREHRLELMAQCEELHKRLRASEQERQVAESRLPREMSVLAQQHELREKELLFRLESSEEAHQRAAQELREMLAAQHHIGTRWREESKLLAQKFEKSVSELRGEILQHKRRNEELTQQLKSFKLAKEELAQRNGKLSASRAALQQQLGEVESRAEAAGEQVSVLLSRERELLQERRELHGQLDRLRLHMAQYSAGLQLAASGSAKPSALHHTHTGDPTSLAPPRWGNTLTDLRHSIYQVRQDLGLHHTHLASEHTGAVYHDRRSPQPSPELPSEHSTLSPRDLSPPPSHSSSHTNTLPA